MRIGLIAVVGLASIIGAGALAAEIDSKVIHDYNYIGAGYGYLHDIGDLDIDGHGAIGEFSFEEGNLLVGVAGGYFWAEELFGADVNLWSITPSVGYVARLMGNHLNIIPRVGGSYSQIEFDSSFGSADDDSWSILPGIGLSYAINNRLALNAGYTYLYNFDSEEDDHGLSVGAKVAILEQVGVAVTGSFSEEFGFTGVTGVVEFHF